MLANGILLDDSSSMRDYPDVAKAAITGIELALGAFNGIKGTDVHTRIWGFLHEYYAGMTRKVGENRFASYSPSGNTPLISRSIDLYKAVKRDAETYRGQGIPTGLALLLITDGEPNHDEWNVVGEFSALIDPSDYIVGMGISPKGDENRAGLFVETFTRMKIPRNRIVTPGDSPTAIRRAINQFSQSAATAVAG